MPHTGEALGAVKDRLPSSNPAENEYELGYYLHPRFRGKGIMKEAVRVLLEWGKNVCGVRNVVVMILEDNMASRKVVEGIMEFEREEAKDDWAAHLLNLGTIEILTTIVVIVNIGRGTAGPLGAGTFGRTKSLPRRFDQGSRLSDLLGIHI